MTYRVEYLRKGYWFLTRSFNSFSEAADWMINQDKMEDCPKRIEDNDGNIFAYGRHLPKDDASPKQKPFWIVVSIDKPGPCERDGKPHRHHDTFDAARTEARRLSASARGGRFVVMASQYVTGWVEHTFDANGMEIPF